MHGTAPPPPGVRAEAVPSRAPTGSGDHMSQTTIRVIAIILLISIGVFLLSVLWDPINSLWR